MRQSRLDVAVFIPAFLIAAAVAAALIFAPAESQAWANNAMSAITDNFGWLLVLFGFSAFVFALWLAFGRYGQVKLATERVDKEYSEISWAAMMFSAGIGIGLMSWSFVEPIYYLSTPPLGIEPHSSAAFNWGHMYTLFHWSFVPWTLYAIPAVAVAYRLYVRQRPFLRISEACRPVFKKHSDGALGALTDTLILLGLLGGAGTSLGLGVPLVSELVSHLFGVEDSIGIRLGVIGFWALLFGGSAYRGLKQGIRWLSDINIVLAIIVVLFVLFAGPTVFILSLTMNSLGLLLDSFAQISFWLAPVTGDDFPDKWTLFYWAWWIAYAPLMGLFIGRISKGRTIKSLVLGTLSWGSLGCMTFLAVCGAYAQHLELTGTLEVSAVLAESGIPATVVAILETLPFSTVVIAVFTLLSFVFLATTLDSSAYVLASISTKNLAGDEEPARWNRVAWAVILAALAVGLLVIDALDTVKASTIMLALPLIPLLLVLFKSLLNQLHEDFGQRLARPELVVSVQKNHDQEGAKNDN
ncbi:BCCT family transporter [Idiomarina sp. PL1-037]|uniref:BCCT family transporter n=1 Tax=Idiomarina sp. PL1-037 TaxID=3095365 RepID=UPI002ACC286E|nr:BCCT family transporter [Idiomarina sp. PL1-037]WQC53514.1 BCCT family transporter [Idiomarina sp. PL1-037]